MRYRTRVCAMGALLLVGCSDGSAPVNDGGVACAKPTATEQAAFATCVATTAQPPCESAGGSWVVTWATPYCSCPTGRANCRCSGPDDCLGGCVHEMPGQPSPPTSCSGISQGRCRGFGPATGCGCWFDPAPSYRCVDP